MGEPAATKIGIKVVPGASKSEIVGWMGNELKIRVAAPPEKGAANRAVIKLLSTTLGVPARQVRIEAGAAAQRKVVSIAGFSRERIVDALRGGVPAS